MLIRLIANRFEVEREAGAGGMGTVYRAYDRQSGTAVAVKVLRGIDRGDIDRFEREARVIAGLHHASIVRYVAHGTDDAGDPYLAMEWLEGEDLGHRLQRSRLTVAESIAIGRAVAEALSLMHAQDVVHRDLKPSNLFLPAGDSRRIKIIDFGIARLGFATQHAGQCARLVDGTQAIVIMGEGAAMDRAAMAARCAIALRTRSIGYRIALATGRGSMSGRGPVGETIDRAAKLLLEVSEGQRRGLIQIDELTAGLLGDRFDVRADSGSLALYSERQPGEEPRTLLGKPTTCVGRDRELRMLEEL